MLRDTLKAFRSPGAALLEAKGDGAPLEVAVAAAGGWQKLEGIVAAADPLAHVVEGWPRFRRHAPRMLRALEIQATGAGEPMPGALRAIAAGSRDMIYWNTAHLGEALRHRQHDGLPAEPELLAHISPLGWAHILLTGEYRWPKRR